MSRIPRDNRDSGIPGETIEHFIPLELKDGHDIGQGLDYQNLFAVCHGNTRKHEKGMRRKSSIESLTCDKHRGNIIFRKINPCLKETLKTIFYTMDGEISATDADVRFDLVNTLNLNCSSSPIVAERKAALDELIADLGKYMDQRDLLHTYCVDRLEQFSNEQDPKTPYVGIIIWYLQSLADASLSKS